MVPAVRMSAATTTPARTGLSVGTPHKGRAPTLVSVAVDRVVVTARTWPPWNALLPGGEILCAVRAAVILTKALTKTVTKRMELASAR